MNHCCTACQGIVQKEHDLSSHSALITIWAEETMKDEESLYVFFCKECFSLLSMKLSIDNPMDDDVSLFEGELNDKLIRYFALALWAENRREEVEQRRSFLKNRLMPIYEPIDEKEFELIKKAQSDKETVIRTPYFPEWYDNIEDALASFDGDAEWDESFSFSYADTLDLNMISSTEIPRYYRTYLVPANEIEPLLRIELHEPPHLSVWKQTVSRIEKISIWDQQRGKNIPMEEFASTISNEELFLEPMNEEEKKKRLEPYVEWIKAQYLLNAVVK